MNPQTQESLARLLLVLIVLAALALGHSFARRGNGNGTNDNIGLLAAIVAIGAFIAFTSIGGTVTIQDFVTTNGQPPIAANAAAPKAPAPVATDDNLTDAQRYTQSSSDDQFKSDARWFEGILLADNTNGFKRVFDIQVASTKPTGTYTARIRTVIGNCSGVIWFVKLATPGGDPSTSSVKVIKRLIGSC